MTSPVPYPTSLPKRGSRQYIEILKIGCGADYDYWGEFRCDHGYEWDCEDCPINVEYWKQQKGQKALCVEIDLADSVTTTAREVLTYQLETPYLHSLVISRLDGQPEALEVLALDSFDLK